MTPPAAGKRRREHLLTLHQSDAAAALTVCTTRCTHFRSNAGRLIAALRPLVAGVLFLCGDFPTFIYAHPRSLSLSYVAVIGAFS